MANKLYDYKLNDEFEILLLIKSAVERETKNGNPFLTITFQDTSGEMHGNRWGVTPEEVEMLQPGRVVYVKGKREEYNGQPQLRIDKIRLAEGEEDADPESYIRQAPWSRPEMIRMFNEALSGITNQTMYEIVRHLLNKYNKEFFESPAAKSNHHAFKGGLAYHTISMINIAKAIVDYYPNINRSLLYAGLILHDLGKVIELDGYESTQYTLEGQLIGHIVLVDQEIQEACEAKDIDPKQEDVTLLRHVILAHHGELAFGSPVRPQVKEAEIIHYIDQIDAKINMIEEALEKTEAGEFTPKVWALENRRFFKPTIVEAQEESE